MSDRRVKVQRDDRIVINREFESVEEFIREYVTNLSRSGAFIRSKTPLPVGTRCHLKFSVIMEEIETIEGIGEVVRVSKSPMGMGVVFVQLNEHSQDLIAKLLTRRAPSQAPIAQPPAAQSGQHAQAPRNPTPAASKAAPPASAPAPGPSRTTDLMMTPSRPQQGAAAPASQSSPRVTRAMPGFGSGSIPGVDPSAGLKGPGALKGLSAQPSGGGGGGAGSGSGDGGTGKPNTTLPPTSRAQINNAGNNSGGGGGNTNPRGSAPKPGGRARVNTPPTITTPRATKK